ncbi:MAG TPA: hypothetical protein VEH29_17015, partial [Acidimicrobiales bacterium]|nr:hypothetical protein [Acidimicrobiales bacterium]
ISAFVAPVGVGVQPIIGQSSLSVGHTLSASQQLTSPNGLYSLVMQGHAELVEYLGDRPLWSTSDVPAWFSDASRRSDLTLQLNDAAGVTVDGPYGPLQTEQPQTGVLDANEALMGGQQLVSSNGLYTLTMQSDGNLVESTAGLPLWSTGTAGHPGDRALVQTDGNFVVYSPSNSAVWSTHTRSRSGNITLVLEADGDLVVNGPSGSLWSNNV